MQTFPPAPGRRAAPAARWILVGAAALVTLGAAAMLVPRSVVAYEVADGALVVHAHAGLWDQGRSVPLAAITSSSPARIGGARRTAGTGMPGYCTGEWTVELPAPEPVWMATSCGPDVVRIAATGADRPWVLSPADPTAFLAALAAGTPGVFPATPAAPAPGWFRALPVAFALFPVLLVLALVIAPLRLGYRVGSGKLVLPTLLGWRTYTLAGATARPCAPHSAVRIVGTSLPDYSAGTFRLDGKATRVWATRLDEGVCIEHPSGWRLFVTPADAPAFRAALVHNGVVWEGAGRG